MKFRQICVVGAAGLLAGSLIAGCGSSSNSSQTASSTAAQSSSTATGAQIVIGNIGSYTGPQASSQGAGPKVMNAWAKWVNSHGGVNGHPVKLIVKDDGGVPAQSEAAVKQLIEQDHVVAIVADQTDLDQTWASYVASKGVPVIGGIGVNTTFVTNPDFFASGQNVFASLYHVLTLAKSVGPKFAFLYCAESPTCASAGPLVQGVAKAVGETVSLTAKVSATAPDYTAICQELKASGVQSYEFASGSTTVIRLATACAAQGVKAATITTDGTITGAWATAPALDGALAAELSFPWFDDSTPATKEYQDALARYAPDLGDANGPNPSYGWVGAKLFEKAVENVGSAPITSASLKQGLYKMKGETLGGLIGPVTFTEGKPGLINCGFTVGLKDGKFTEPDGLTTTCAPDAVVNGILAKLTGG
jgi:branched-chain amino acid transport system substrate-binding protein